MILKRIILIFVLMMSCYSYSQDKGIIKFLVDVDNGYFEIVINDTIFLKRYKDSLPVGNYTAKIWSPGYVITETEFKIEKDKTTETYVPMAKSNGRIQYEYDYTDYRMQFHKSLTIPVTTTLVTSLATGWFMMRSFDLKKVVGSDVELYSKSSVTSEIAEIKLRIDENNRKYNRNRISYYVTGGLSTIYLVGTICSYINFKKDYTEPVLNSESPFKDRFSFRVNPFSANFTYTFG